VVTWIFIDVTDPNADPTGQTVGDQLIVDSTHTYADLDELIVNHIQAMARRCEELMAHEKFKQGGEDELREFEDYPIAFFCIYGSQIFSSRISLPPIPRRVCMASL
jgi:hypothetical protein